MNRNMAKQNLPRAVVNARITRAMHQYGSEGDEHVYNSTRYKE